MTKVLSLRVSDEIADQIDAMAEDRGVKRTELLATFVEEGLNPIVFVRTDMPRDEAVARAKAAVPQVKTGADLLRERQMRLNKQIGWAEE